MFCDRQDIPLHEIVVKHEQMERCSSPKSHQWCIHVVLFDEDCFCDTELQIRRVYRENLGIISHISP